jgi:acetyltransferase-like isoleucine patch superfamily enzyme
MRGERERRLTATAVYEWLYDAARAIRRARRDALDALWTTGHSTTSPTHLTMIRKKRLPLGHLALYGWLPSPIKVWAYRTFRGYKIGKGVKLAFGGVVVGENVELGDHVEIGLLAMVMGRTISIGRHSSVGTMSYLSCERIQIGEDARIREQVFVGGPQLPESSFTLGSRTIILQLTSINPTKPVTIGDDTGIGGHCLIFTHGAWLNALDGYPVTYEAVTLGNSVWLPWRVFVMPGTTIGDGSVIGANSLVQGTIPPMSLAVGSPAKVIRSAPDFPRVASEEKRAALVAEMISEFERYITYEHYAVEVRASTRSYRPANGGAPSRLIWRRTPDDALVATRGDTVLSEVALGEREKAELRSSGVYWLDLAGRSRSAEGSPLTEELASFISRYGIRLPRDG